MSNCRATIGGFAEVDITIVYVWNSTPFDGVYITRSIPTIGRKLWCPRNNNSLQRKFTLASNNIYSTLAYIHLAHADHSFAPSILEILVEDRHVIYAERINDNRNIISYEESDLVISHTEVDIGTEKDCVGISSYQDTEPF